MCIRDREKSEKEKPTHKEKGDSREAKCPNKVIDKWRGAEERRIQRHTWQEGGAIQDGSDAACIPEAVVQTNTGSVSGVPPYTAGAARCVRLTQRGAQSSCLLSALRRSLPCFIWKCLLIFVVVCLVCLFMYVPLICIGVFRVACFSLS